MCHYHRTQSTRLIVEGFRSHEMSGAPSRDTTHSFTVQDDNAYMYRRNPTMVVTRSFGDRSALEVLGNSENPNGR